MIQSGVEIPFPLQGLDEGWAYGKQPPGTTPDCQNVRAVDPTTGRGEGSQRGGTAKFNSNQISGTNPIQAGCSLTVIDGRLTYTVRTAPEIVWQRALPGNLSGIAAVTDRGGNLYVLAVRSDLGAGVNHIAKYNPDGELVYSFPVALPSTSHVLKSIRVDDEGAVFCCIAGATGASAGFIYKYVPSDGAEPLRKAWELEAPEGGLWADFVVRDGWLYGIEGTDVDFWLHRYEGTYTAAPDLIWSGRVCIRHRSENSFCLDAGNDGAAVVGICDTATPKTQNGRLSKYGPHPFKTGSGTITGNTVASPTVVTSVAHGLTTGDKVYIANSNSTPSIDGAHTVTVLTADTFTVPVNVTVVGSAGTWYHDPREYAVWTYTDTAVGQSVVCRDGSIWSQGYGAQNIRKLTDNGATVTSVWATATITSEFKGATHMAVDRQGITYQAAFNNSGSNTELHKVSAAGSLVWSYDLDTEPFSVALPGELFDVNNGSKCEFVYVCTDPYTTTNYAVHKLRLVDVAQSDGAVRSMRHIAACNGTIKTFVAGATAPATPTGGSSALSTSAQFVMCAKAKDTVLWTDGLVYKRYDALDDAVTTWAATVGEIPKRGRQVSYWRNRPVVYDFEDQPHNWAMGRQDTLDDFDFFPPVTDGQQAVIGNQCATGECPDVLNTFIPYSDDLAFAGGDHTIHRLTGDPAADGVWDMVSDVTGIARGQTWCKTSAGVLYFIGARGGLYRMVPGGVPECLSEGRFHKRLTTIDFSTTKVLVVWRDADQSVLIYLTPYVSGSTTHYAYDTVRGALWPDAFGNNNIGPTAAWVADGDAPGDRVEMIGGRDGYVRYLGDSLTDDDGTLIDSWVYILGRPSDGRMEFKISDIRAILATGSSDVTWELYAAESADFAQRGSAVATGTLSAGRNDAINYKTRGAAVWLRLRSLDPAGASVAQKWALEGITAGTLAGGKSRNR